MRILHLMVPSRLVLTGKTMGVINNVLRSVVRPVGRNVGSPKGVVGSWSSYWTTRHTELATYITGLTTPLSEAQIIRLGQFLETLKTGLSITNLSDVFDVMYILAGETGESSLKNLVKNAHHGTLSIVGSTPAFTQYEGFNVVDVNTAPGHIDTNYNPSADGLRYTLNDASIGVYSRTSINSPATRYEAGAYSTSNSVRTRLAINYFTSYAAVGINNTTGLRRFTPSDGLGMFIGTRNAATTGGLILYKNKTTPASTIQFTPTSSGLPDANMYILAMCEDNFGMGHSLNQISFFFMGKYITTAMRDVIVDAFEVYMDANGKGII